MKNRKELLRLLKKEIELLQYKTSNPKAYNDTIKSKKRYYKSLILLDKAMPHFLSLFIVANFIMPKDNSPFRRDVIEMKSSKEDTYYSDGRVTTTESFDKKYSSRIFEYSTEWYINEQGLYEQVTTYYRYNELDDIDKTLMLEKEDLDKMFTIIDVKKTIKNSITDEEQEKKPVLKISVVQSSGNTKYRNEYWWELVLNFLLYIGVSELIAIPTSFLKRKLTKEKLKGYIEDQIAVCEPVQDEDIAELKEILKIKLANYEALTGKEVERELKRRVL